jgi:hypothetical protein
MIEFLTSFRLAKNDQYEWHQLLIKISPKVGNIIGCGKNPS